MTPLTETTKRNLFHALAGLKSQKKMTRMLNAFEELLEEHLEALRQEYERTVMISADAIDRQSILRDAYDRQVQLTQSALKSEREAWDLMRAAQSERDSAQNERDDQHDKARETVHKLASQTQTIISMHRVIKWQQKALEKSQAGLRESVEICNRTKSEMLAEIAQEQARAYRQIMQAEALADTRLIALEEKQKLIVSQRKAFKNLLFSFALLRDQVEKPSFWRFFTRK